VELSLPRGKRLVWPGWRHLPRDSRDTLFQLAVIGWTVLPHLSHLAPWCIALTALMLGWRAHIALSNSPLPSRWLVAGVLLVAAVLTLGTERTLFGKEAGVTMLVVLMALKTLELRARRDAMVVFFLGFFLVLTNFLYSQSLATAAAMLLSVWGLLTALVLAHMPVGKPTLRQASTLAARAAALGAPLMLALFLLFPRIGPLWGMPQDAAGKTGLSGSMQMGAMAEIANDDAIALRIRFFGRVPPPEAMYFRGPVLSRFDGFEWTRQPGSASSSARQRSELTLLGQPLRYEMTLEPSRLPLLPLLELTPERADTAPNLDGALVAWQSADLQWQTDRPVAERLRFEAQAWLLHRHGPRQMSLMLRDHVALPPGYNPRTLQWAADLARRPDLASADGRTRVAAVLEHVRNGGYSYTLAPGTYGRDAVDEFWLDRKLGFCEHFAASMVVVLRALDVPSRVVTGYQGTDALPVDGWYIVRQSHAHAWVEYWQSGEGWVRVDPTAAVAPDRIVRGNSLVPQPGLMAGALRSVSPQLMAQLRSLVEAANNRWNQWVMNYSRGQQMRLLESLGVQAPSWHDLAYALIALLCAGSLGGAGWALWDRWRQDPWQRLQRRVQQRLALLQVAVAPHEPPRTRARKVRETLGDAGEGLAQQLEALDRARYGSAGRTHRPERGWWQTFDAAAGAVPRPRGHRATASAAAAIGMLALMAVGAAESVEAQTRRARTLPAEVPASAAGAYGTQRDDVSAFAAEVAARRGLDERWVLAQLAQARRQPAAQRLIMPAPAGTAKNWAAYRDRFVEPQRVTAGLRFWNEHADWLQRAEERYGVPAELVVGIIGVETFYGRITGNFRVLDVLATLAFDFPSGRSDRSGFFRGELEEFLVLSRREGMDPSSVKGSFAGAIGLPQFMPGSINRYAIDFDGDGHVDLQRSAPDVIGSVASYMAAHGWQRGMPATFAVAAPSDTRARATLLQPDIVPSFSAQQMAELGAELEPAARTHEGLLALVELQNGAAAPSFVAGTSNFYAVTRYNWSSYYAMAVLALGEAVKRQR
jgi:protein-glutamine gamma-glutamyltransferase